MTPTDQVTPLEQSRRLKELGVKQESLFEWAYYPSVQSQILSYRGSMLTPLGEPIAAAFTVAELGMMLPDDFVKDFDFGKYIIPKSGEYTLCFNSWFFISADNKRVFGCRYDHDGNINIGTPSFWGSEAESRAKLLIHLLENNLITVEEVNSRLAASPDPAHR